MCWILITLPHVTSLNSATVTFCGQWHIQMLHPRRPRRNQHPLLSSSCIMGKEFSPLRSSSSLRTKAAINNMLHNRRDRASIRRRSLIPVCHQIMSNGNETSLVAGSRSTREDQDGSWQGQGAGSGVLAFTLCCEAHVASH